MTKPILKRRIRNLKTPVRAALRVDSLLQRAVQDGLGAVISAHHGYFDDAVRSSFADSLDLDNALKKGREQENRWDYLLGYQPTGQVVGVEPHSAENGEVTTVIKKLEAARRQLQEHLCDGRGVSKWLWVASGRVRFVPIEKATLRLAQNGIEFIGRRITNKHLG